ncbi:MAG: ABC transporter substrate-binding protein [Acidobacteria bacterium]|nr:ABC transporter substrate-binding protein [Acidobacteriota bacterium]
MYRKLEKKELLHLIIAVAALSLLVACASCQQPPQSNKRVTIGIQTSPAMALVMVAKDKQFFAQEGIDAELKEFTAGKFALQAFLGGSLDFAVAGEVPVTLSTLQGSQFRVLAQVVEKTISEVRVVARREDGVNDAATYFKKQKRKLATSFGGGPEFFTYNFLKRHGIAANEVEILSQQPQDMPAALVNGSVDAISIFDPFAFIAEKQMGDKGVTFADPDIYSELYVITVRQAMLDQNRATVDGLIRAMVKAQQFINDNPDQAKEIVIKYTKLDRDVVDGIWKNFVFAAALNQRLLDYQNQQAAWAKEKGTVPANATVPDFRQAIFADALKGVKPEAVQLP